jgi:SAM-dependent methyltransferase
LKRLSSFIRRFEKQPPLFNELAYTSRRYYENLKVSKVVAADDHMWNTGQAWYFTVGESGLKACINAASQSYLPSVRRILDIPCGHGRVARYLRAGFPDAAMFFCEIDKSGADFCAREFGGTAVYSRPELTEIDIPGDLDLIWIGSLFTHVDEDRTRRWLRHLASRLAPNGVLVATFHGLLAITEQTIRPMIDDAAWRSILEQYGQTGFGYASYTGYELGDYGISVSNPSKIMEIATSIPETRVLSYSERGWADNHDVLALVKNDRARQLL